MGTDDSMRSDSHDAKTNKADRTDPTVPVKGPKLRKAKRRHSCREHDQRTDLHPDVAQEAFLDQVADHQRPDDGTNGAIFVTNAFEGRVRLIQQTGEVREVLATDEIFELKKDRAIVGKFWIDVEGASQADIMLFADCFDLHPITCEDCIVDDEDDKREYFDSEHDDGAYVFMVVNTLCDDVDLLIDENPTISLNIALFNHYVLSFHNHNVDAIIDSVVNRMRLVKYRRKDLFADWVAYALMDTIADDFLPHVRRFVREVDILEDQAITAVVGEQSDFLQKATTARRRLHRLQKVLEPKHEMLSALTAGGLQSSSKSSKGTMRLFAPAIAIYLRDVLDHVDAMVDDLQAAREVVANAQSTYLSKVSVEMALVSNRINIVMKVIALVSVIFLPLTLVLRLLDHHRHRDAKL